VSEQDRIFVKNFALVITMLIIFTVIIAIAAANFNKLATRPDNPDRQAAVEARIAPIGQVRYGEAGEIALAEAQAGATAPVAMAAFDGSLDGKMIYDNVCAVCHTAGVAGSPKLEQAAWVTRLEQGMDTLVEHAINGYQGEAGVMPARGGKMDLTDEQVRVTVQWMVDNLE